jgi:hypothetical protein
MTNVDISMDEIEEYLDHHGVKGMKWGVRKEDSTSHRKWLKGAKSGEAATQIFQDAAKSFAPEMKKINNNPMFKGKDLNKDPQLREMYDTIVEKTFNQHLANASVNQTFNAKLNRSVIYQFDRHTQLMRATEMKLAQSALDGFPDFPVSIDENGFVTEIHPPEDTMRQDDLDISVEDIDEYIEHFGVKGMRWGVRKRDGGGVRSSSEARKAAQARSKPIHALTNKQLKAATERMNLEQNFKRLNPSKVEKGKKAALEVLATVGIAVSAYNIVKSPAGQAAIKQGKRLLQAS